MRFRDQGCKADPGLPGAEHADQRCLAGADVLARRLAQRRDIACLALKCPVVDFAEELRLTFGSEEVARWQATDTIPNLMGGQDRVRLQYDFYEDCLRQIAYGPAERITVPTLIVQGEQDECAGANRHPLSRLPAPREGMLVRAGDRALTEALEQGTSDHAGAEGDQKEGP